MKGYRYECKTENFTLGIKDLIEKEVEVPNLLIFLSSISLSHYRAKKLRKIPKITKPEHQLNADFKLHKFMCNIDF